GRVDLSVVLEDEGEVEPVIDDPLPGQAVTEENADFRPRHRERVGGPKPPPSRDLVDLLLRETRTVDRRHDFALDRQAGPKRPDGRCARTRALQMENKGFGPAQDWLTLQRPAIVTAPRARGGLDTHRSAPSHPARKRERRAR